MGRFPPTESFVHVYSSKSLDFKYIWWMTLCPCGVIFVLSAWDENFWVVTVEEWHSAYNLSKTLPRDEVNSSEFFPKWAEWELVGSRLSREEAFEQDLERSAGLWSAGESGRALFYCHVSTILLLKTTSSVLEPSFNIYPTLFFSLKHYKRTKIGKNLLPKTQKKHYHKIKDQYIVFH